MVPSGIAPQLTAMYLACFLGEFWWMIFGIFSFPTPLSPVTKTEISVAATRKDFSKARFSPSLIPMIPKRCFMA